MNAIKKYLLEPPLLVSPSSRQTIDMYLTASHESASIVLFRDKDEKPIYFISNKLAGGEPNYTKLRKVVLALVLVARRLKPSRGGQ